jgi:hypothetical protein
MTGAFEMPVLLAMFVFALAMAMRLGPFRPRRG